MPVLKSNINKCLFFLLLVVIQTTAHDVIESLLFEDANCTNPLGRMVLEANGNCHCLECHVLSRRLPTVTTVETETETETLPTHSLTEGSATITQSETVTLTETKSYTESLTETVTLTQSESLSLTTSGVSLTSTPTNETAPDSDFFTWKSEDLADYIFNIFRDSITCPLCSRSDYTTGIAECSPDRKSFKMVLTTSGSCPADDALNATTFVDITLDKCVAVPLLGGDFAYMLLAASTCQIAPEQDRSISNLEIAFYIVLSLFFVLFLIAAGFAIYVHRKMRHFFQLKSDQQQASKQANDMRKKLKTIRGRLEGQQEDTVKVSKELEAITGRNKFNNGLCEAAIGIPPPALPLREQLDHLAAKMAEVEEEVHIQQQIARDAMI